MAIEKHRPVSAPPVHPASALVIIVLDNIFGAYEFFNPFTLALTSISVALLGTFAVSLLQRFRAKEDWGTAIVKGLVMGVIAGVPYPITGTIIGTPLLIWSGVHAILKLPSPGGTKVEQFEAPDQEA